MFKKFFMLRDKAGEGDGGGAGGGKPDPKPNDEMAALKTQNADLLKRLEALEGKSKPDPKPDDQDLAAKAALEREKESKKAEDQKRIEASLKFTLGSKDWLKNNESLLPKNVASIFEQAEKENYNSAIEKASAIKVGLVSEFFSVQANLDLLTPGLKSALEDFQKLTKNGKQERIETIFDTVFEPAFAMLKAVKKAEQVSKGGRDSTDSENAYKNKLMSGSRKHYLGEKTDGT